MNTYKRREVDIKGWTVRLPNYPQERRKSIAALAARHRQSVGAYVATLLDEEIRKAEAMEEGR